MQTREDRREALRRKIVPKEETIQAAEKKLAKIEHGQEGLRKILDDLLEVEAEALKKDAKKMLEKIQKEKEHIGEQASEARRDWLQLGEKIAQLKKERMDLEQKLRGI